MPFNGLIEINDLTLTLTLTLTSSLGSARDFVRVKFDILSHGDRTFFRDKKYPMCYFYTYNLSQCQIISNIQLRRLSVKE